METIPPKKRRVNEKSPEIQRFLLFLKSTGIQVYDIADKTDFTARTINNFIWENKPISGHLLRDLCVKFDLSLDWLLTGEGEMLLAKAKGNEANESPASYGKKKVDSKSDRLCLFVSEFTRTATADERTWLEMQFKLHIPQYLRFLERNHDA